MRRRMALGGSVMGGATNNVLPLIIVITLLIQRVASARGATITCYDCTEEKSCFQGRCFDGDSCVKVLIGTYVSKGCLNREATKVNVSMKCEIQNIFGEEATICYCDDKNLCNSSIVAAYHLPFITGLISTAMWTTFRLTIFRY